MTDTNGDAVIRRFAESKALRAPYEGDWRQIAERILPRQVGAWSMSPDTLVRGMPINRTKMIDVTGAKALNAFQSIMISLITPQQYQWQILKASNKELMKEKRVRDYFYQATQALFEQRYSSRSGFVVGQGEHYVNLGAYGNGWKFVEKPRKIGNRTADKGLRYRALSLAGCYVLTDEAGVVTHFFRPFPLNARQYVAFFNEADDRIPDEVMVEYRKQGGPSETKMFTVVHYVGPNHDLRPYRLDHKSMEWKSCYVHEKTKDTVREAGFTTWPFPGSRFWTSAGETYGSSVASMALGSLASLNRMKTDVLVQGQRAVSPVLLTHDDGAAENFDMYPGSLNSGFVTADGKPLLHTLPVGDVQAGIELMDAERKDVNDLFLVNLFQILIEHPEMTATEVMERASEKGALLAPIQGRQSVEDLDPMTERELDLMAQQDLLPDMPPELLEAKGEYTVTYDNPLTRYMRQSEATGFMRTTEFALQAAQATQNPAYLHRLNFDKAIPLIAELNGVPSILINDDAEVERLTQQMAGQQQTQTAIEAAPAIASLMKTMQPGARRRAAA